MTRLSGMFLCGVSLLWGAEGKWTPEQVLELAPQWLKSQGLELPPQQLWDPERGMGLLSAAVQIGGCSAAFVSASGLILTNHHCLFSILQEHSTPQRDLITQGFLARTASEELRGKATRVTIPRRFSDVTREVAGSVPPGADDLTRQKAVEARQKALVADCEKKPGTRCQVAVFDGGLRYTLIEALELSDVRLVYAPPRAVGEFGGETDNWMWPRHTGDFALARAYQAGGVPFRPAFFFPLSRHGVKPGDFVMVLGYPGVTTRSMTAAEMAERRDETFGRRHEVYGAWIRLLEDAGKQDAAGRIALAATVKTLYNSHKNAAGQLAGLARGNIIEKQRAADTAVVEWARSRPEWKEALAAKAELDAMVEARRQTAARDFLFSIIPNGPVALAHAVVLVRLAGERQKPDAERDPSYMNRELGRLRDRLERAQKNYFPPADQALLRDWLERALAAGPTQPIAAVAEHFGSDREGLPRRVAALYESTRVMDLAERLKMFEETPAQLRARRDPLLGFAFALDEALRAWKQQTDRQTGAHYRLRPAWRRAVIAHAGKPVAPDANGTLRVSFAHVKGYAPRDGVFYTPQTTLRGLLEKHTGQNPFDVPAPVLAAARAGRYGSWRDPRLNDVPVCFLADADTTGGNSGSPVVNGRGELVGVNFDRVWENVANDFGYNPEVARNISADIRYLLWILDQVEGAEGLLRELGLRL